MKEDTLTHSQTRMFKHLYLDFYSANETLSSLPAAGIVEPDPLPHLSFLLFFIPSTHGDMTAHIKALY